MTGRVWWLRAGSGIAAGARDFERLVFAAGGAAVCGGGDGAGRDGLAGVDRDFEKMRERVEAMVRGELAKVEGEVERKKPERAARVQRTAAVFGGVERKRAMGSSGRPAGRERRIQSYA